MMFQSTLCFSSFLMQRGTLRRIPLFRKKEWPSFPVLISLNSLSLAHFLIHHLLRFLTIFLFWRFCPWSIVLPLIPIELKIVWIFICKIGTIIISEHYSSSKRLPKIALIFCHNMIKMNFVHKNCKNILFWSLTSI